MAAAPACGCVARRPTIRSGDVRPARTIACGPTSRGPCDSVAAMPAVTPTIWTLAHQVDELRGLRDRLLAQRLEIARLDRANPERAKLAAAVEADLADVNTAMRAGKSEISRLRLAQRLASEQRGRLLPMEE